MFYARLYTRREFELRKTTITISLVFLSLPDDIMATTASYLVWNCEFIKYHIDSGGRSLNTDN